MKLALGRVTWLFWILVYAARPRPRDLGAILLRGQRLRRPGKKFRPSVYHNDDGKEWHVFFTGEQAYVEKRTIELECLIGMETGNIVGFDVWDEKLDLPKVPQKEMRT